MIESLEISGRYFLIEQQYAYIGVRPIAGVKHFVVEIDEVEYNIPNYAVAVLMQETPSEDMRGGIERLEDYINRDPVPLIYGRNDAVKAAKELLGVDITAKKRMDQADYDGIGLAALEARLREAGAGITYPQKVGVNETGTDRIIPREPEPEFNEQEFNEDFD